MTNFAPGLLVTFEGVEGSGKSTQIALLKEDLEAAGARVFMTREPGGDATAEKLREVLLNCPLTPRAELLLFMAARAQNVEQVIRPRLADGEIVLCDRFTDSSMAYQGHARGLGRDPVYTLNAFATNGISADITVLLDLDPSVGLARQQQHNRMESETIEFHRLVRQGFLHEAEKDPLRFLVLDASADPQEVQALIRERVFNAWKGTNGAPREMENLHR